MSLDPISKFQPDRTMYLRGFTGFGAAASLYGASPTGFNVSGVFRDMADFCVLVLYDADNTFEHYSTRYLPDFDFSGVTLSFDLTYQGLQPIDSAKYSWIDWSQMDVVTLDRTTGADIVRSPRIRLWDYATLKSGSYTVASGTYKITAPGNCTIYDRLTLFINNVGFDFYSAKGGETAGWVARNFANMINSRDWSTYEENTVSVVIASADDTGNLTLKNGRTGHVNVDGVNVAWVDGIKFPGIAAGSAIYLGGTQYFVQAVTSPTSLVLTTPAQTGSNIVYLAEYGGVDGNSVCTYMVVRPGNKTLAVDRTDLQLSGGNSGQVTWSINLDFDALGISFMRQAWLTFAPQLTTGAPYADTEWTAAFTNWTITSKKNNTELVCAGPGSVRIGNDEASACQFTGGGWTTTQANNYWHGFGKRTSTIGDAVTISYKCLNPHDLYLGTALDSFKGVLGVSMDGDACTSLDCYLGVSSEIVTRRLLRKSVSAGTHTVTITLASLLPSGSNRAPKELIENTTRFLFDFLEAAIPGRVPGAIVTYPNVSPALDFDTDATYKVSPQRLLWHLSALGFAGQINEYLGVFWWNQRCRVQSTWNSIAVTFSGTWVDGDIATLSFDSVPLRKTVTTWDTVDTIAKHFVYYINAGSIIIRAEHTGPGQLTIYTRTPNWRVDFATANTSSSGLLQAVGQSYDQAKGQTVSLSAPALDYGVDGVWQIDPTQAEPLNFPVRQWHSDFFRLAKSMNLEATVAFSMELVNPPFDDDTPSNAWCARYYNRARVETDTGFSNLKSTQCAPVPNLTTFQKSAFASMAALQSAAGLVPWLQFGEFLWWFFSSFSAPIGYCSFTDPISVGFASPHGLATGDRVVLSGVRGCAAANGTWTITVTDATHFTIPVSADGAWTVGSGWARSGSMALYDAATTAAAQTALGRPLYKFTCQDDDPSVNGRSDVSFLAAQLKAHVDGIRQAVLAQYPEAKFEILFPNDVNNPSCYHGPSVPYPQGGRLNAAMNLPPEWLSKESSGLDRFKVEALSWGSQYLNLNLADQAMNLALSQPFSWKPEDVAYLVPWFNGTCPWRHEFHSSLTRGLGLINFWAYDHLALMSWPLPLNPPARKSFRKY